jgi:hypothetical protein
MRPSATDALDSFRAYTVEERRALLGDLIRDFAARNGRDETIRILLENISTPPTVALERQAETLAVFARLPEDAATQLLAPFDPNTVSVKDCMSDVEVNRIVTGMES